jgi:hypothetical protein
MLSFAQASSNEAMSCGVSAFGALTAFFAVAILLLMMVCALRRMIRE